MKAGLPRSTRGIALVMAMIAVFVLAVLIGAFAYSMKVEMQLARNSNNGEALIWAGYSGVEQAKSILAQANCPYEALNQKWAGGSGSECETNGAYTDLPMDNVPIRDAAGTQYGSFSIKITDMERKININTVPDTVIQRALEAIGVDASESSIVVDGIMDWIDPNPNSNVRRPNGAKSDYYQGLTPAYYAKNGPIDELSELLLIRGVSQDIYWGAASTNHAGAFFQRRDRFGRIVEQPMYSAGLVDIFTAIGGKVNVNTASATVLQAIPGIDENIAEQIVSMRAQEPFRNIGELINAGVNPGLIGTIGQFCDVHSRTFEVQVEAEVGGTKGTFYSIIARTGPRSFQTLGFYWK